MIQRQQSLWFLLAATCSVLSFMFPFYAGNVIPEGTTVPTYKELDGASHFLLLILTGASVLAGLIGIFLFKDRKTQLKIAVAGMLISLLLLIIYIAQTKKFIDGRITLSAILIIAIVIGFFMAARGIWKDEKLVKSLDKLR